MYAEKPKSKQIKKPIKMKKLFYLLAITLVTTSAMNAQFFAGGGFSLSTSGGSTDNAGTTTDKTKTTSFSFSPMGGYIVSEKIYAGAYLNLGIGTSKTTAPETKTTTTSFGLTPFVRYYALQMNKFSIFGQAQLGFSLSKQKNEAGGTTTDGPKTSSIGFSIFPGLAYDINDKVQLYAAINGFNFGFNHTVVKQDIAGNEYVDKTNTFGMGVNLGNLATSGNLTIGMIYKF